VADIVPVVVCTKRYFRGRHKPHLAALRSCLARQLGLDRDGNDLLGYCAGPEKVVTSIEWQDAFDQERRLHEPRSSGFLLQVKETLLGRIAQTLRVDLWACLSVSRTTDRYKPESEMEWHSYTAIFPVSEA
jgi:hypothetical protein